MGMAGRMSGTERRSQVLGIAAVEFADRGLHGASIEVHSTEGVGSLFEVSFVARDARPAVAVDMARVPSTKI